jgi:hypothetical protein
MARITSITVGVAKTINLGDFNSIKINASVVVEISDPSELEGAHGMAQEELGKLMSETYRAQRRQPPGEGQA